MPVTVPTAAELAADDAADRAREGVLATAINALKTQDTAHKAEIAAMKAQLALLTAAVTELQGGAPPPPPPPPAPPPPPVPPPPPPGPKLATIGKRITFGMFIGRKDYDTPAYQAEIARMDAAVLGPYRNQKLDIRACCKAIKARNPSIKLFLYSNIVECSNDHSEFYSGIDMVQKLDAMGWWLLNSAGEKLKSGIVPSKFDTNFLEWTPADSNGLHFTQWLAKRDYELFYRDNPSVEGVYHDNTNTDTRQSSDANWRLDGVNVDGKSAPIAAAFRRAQIAWFDAARALSPTRIMMGNPDNELSDAEYRGKLGGSFYEAAIGAGYSQELKGWNTMMARYRAMIANTVEPHIVGFNIHAKRTEYQVIRYALCSALLENGHFCVSEGNYNTAPWFDEYDQPLGEPAGAPPKSAAAGPIWRREYEGGMVLVNTSKTTGASIDLTGWGLRRFRGTQQPLINDGSEASVVTLQPRDGLVLVRST